MEDEYAAQVRRIAGAVLSAVLKICALIGVGMHLERKGVLNGAKRKCLSALAMDVCLPCLLFSAVLPEANLKLLQEGWYLLLWPLVYASVSSILGVLCCFVVGIPAQHLGAAAACAAFPNVNGFPVSVISALGHAIPKSPNGFSALVFLSVLQLTDGVVKYTVGPAVFRRDLRARQRASCQKCQGEGPGVSVDALPLGSSLHSIVEDVDCHAHSLDSPTPEASGVAEVTDFGLRVEQVRTVEPEWSRFDAYKVFGTAVQSSIQSTKSFLKLQRPLLKEEATPAPSWSFPSTADITDFLRTLCPPQVSAVLLAMALGVGPVWVKSLLVNPEGVTGEPYLGFIFGTAKELGQGFVPLQMISLGGRMLNIVSDSGPLADKGAAGPKGRSKLLRIAGAVGVARMVLAPMVLYSLAVAVNAWYFEPQGIRRPAAFWAPALIVAAMPTANNMSTMADLIGSGRSISAASTALQLLASPVVLVASLSLLLGGASNLAMDSV